MISSAGANKQPRSFWMSSSQRLQQRLPIWSGFSPSVTTDCSSEALATLPTLLVESPAPKNADRSPWREQKSTRHLSGDHRICWLCVYILNLSKLQDCPFFAVILSWSLGSISVEGLFFPLCLPLGDECPTPAISCAGGVDGHLRWDSYKHISVVLLHWSRFPLPLLQFLLFLTVEEERSDYMLFSFCNSYRGQKLN